MYGDAAIAGKANLSLPTTRRMMKGADVGEQHFYKLFRAYLGLPEGPLDEPRKNEVQRLMARFCESEPGAVVKAEAPPRAGRAVSALAALVVYTKCIHLREEVEPGRGFAYRKAIPGLKEPVAVFSEFTSVRSLDFSAAQNSLDMEAHSVGLVSLQPVYPPRLRGNDNRIEGVNTFQLVKHIEEEASAFYQPVVSYLNGFFPSKELFGIRLTHDAGRVVMVVDFSSLPFDLLAGLFTGAAFAVYSRESEEERQILMMDCRKTEDGVFLADSSRAGQASDVAGAWNPAGEIIEAWNPERHTLRKSGKLQIYFPVDWTAVRAAYPLA